MQKTFTAMSPKNQNINRKKKEEFEYRAFVTPAKATVVIRWKRKYEMNPNRKQNAS